MALATPRGPEAAVVHLSHELSAVTPLSVSLRSALADVAPGELSALTPLRLYRLTCQEFLKTRSTGDPTPAGWIYVLVAGGPAVPQAERIPVALAELMEDCEGYRLRGVAVDHDKEQSTVGEFYRAVNQAKEWAGSHPEPYELRVLRLPEIGLSSIWLKGPSPEVDHFIITSPTGRSFQPLQELSAGELVEQVSGVALRAGRAG